MYIALCDDDTTILQTLDACINMHFAAAASTLHIDCFSCAEDFLASGQTYDILFMDIFLQGMNGIAAARAAKRKKYSQIVFITSSREYAVEAFDINAAHYLIKPLTQTGISEALERCRHRMKKSSEKVLEIKSRNDIIPVPMKNIIYIEVFNKVSILHTVKNSIQTYSSLDALSEELDESLFIRAQRSYIVNMKFIESFYYDRIILQNGLEIKLSRNNRNTLKTQYQNYLFDLARKGNP